MTYGMDFLAPQMAQQQMDIQRLRAPLELQQLGAQTQLTQAEAQQRQMQIQQQQKFAALLAAQPQGEKPGTAPSDNIMRLATLAGQAGAVNEALKLTQQASDMKAAEARTLAAQTHPAYENFKMQSQRAQLVGSLLSGVTDQASWNQANAAYELQTGEKSPYADLPYSPGIVQALTHGALSAKQRADLQMKQLELGEKERHNKIIEDHMRTLEGLQHERTEVMAGRARSLKKASGSDVGAPSKAEITAATDTIKSDGSLKLPAQDLNLAATDIASKARALRKANPGMSSQEAIRRAFAEAKAAGDFETSSTLFRETSHYKAQGSPQAPIPLASKPDPKTLKIGAYYQTPRGVGKWTGQGFELIDNSDEGTDSQEYQ